MEWMPDKETPREIPPELRRKMKRRNLWKIIVGFSEVAVGIFLYYLLSIFAIPKELAELENLPYGIQTTGMVLWAGARTDININERHPYEIRYRFKDTNGRDYFGEIWVSQKSRFAQIRAGESVDIVYHRDKPSINKILGSDPMGIPWWVPLLCLVVMLSVGLLFLFLAVKGSAKGFFLLEYGQLAVARVDLIKVLHFVNLGLGIHPAYVTVSFKDDLGRDQTVTVKTTTASLTLKEGESCKVLYDSNEPTKALIVETLSL
jgi:hypothetical protein